MLTVHVTDTWWKVITDAGVFFGYTREQAESKARNYTGKTL